MGGWGVGVGVWSHRSQCHGSGWCQRFGVCVFLCDIDEMGYADRKGRGGVRARAWSAREREMRDDGAVGYHGA